MNASTTTPFARRFSTRLAATLGILLAASWGPLSLAFRLIEVSEISANGKPAAERTVRIVLARNCAFPAALNTVKKSAAPSTGAKSDPESPTTERLLNAAPESLESAQSIHFDLSGVPPVSRVSAWLLSSENFDPFYIGSLTSSTETLAHPARGPPRA